MLKVALPVGLVGKDGYTDSQIRARASVAEKIGIPIIPQVVLYGNGYNKEVVEKGVKDLKTILGYDADSKGLLVHEDYRTNVFFQEGLERARKNMSYFQGQNVAMFLIHFPKLLDYGLEGLLHQRILSRLSEDFRKHTGRAIFDRSPFNMGEYDCFVDKSVKAVLRAKEYARQNGFENALSLETVNAHDFIVVPSEPDLDMYFGGRGGFAKLLGEESQIKFMDRDHIGLERAIAGGIDLGGLTCSLGEINGFSRRTNTNVCIDSEHLNIDHLLSERYNPELLGRIGYSLNDEETRILKNRGFFLTRGLPRIYDKPLNAENIAGNIENTCKVGHMTGGFEPEIRVNGILVPGSHIGIDPESNFFARDDKAREGWWSRTKGRIQRFAKLMEGNGVETVVLEPKLGTYTNGKFVISHEEPHYSQEMTKTVRNFVKLTKID
ncbi:hypothetical protein HYT26_00055 [Candidatus Pacearchaeota archaeon]|nr:hypothetical protein [Candidatus Pacearchaeota archaeon]